MPLSSPQDPSPKALAFLLSQVGAHSAAKFAERVAELDFSPPQVGILKVIAESDGLSQQALGEKLGMFASRLVSVLDDLQTRGLIERRSNPTDRRANSLHITQSGKEKMKQIMKVGREHQESICAALNDSERVQLASLLQRIADEQKLVPGIHPGYRKMGESTAEPSNECP